MKVAGFGVSFRDILGLDEIDRVVSCERYWGFSVDRNVKKFLGEDVK